MRQFYNHPKRYMKKVKTWFEAQTGVLNYHQVLLSSKLIKIPQKIDWEYDSKLYRVQDFLKHEPAKITPALKDYYINSIEPGKKPTTNENEIKSLFERFIKREKTNQFK